MDGILPYQLDTESNDGYVGAGKYLRNRIRQDTVIGTIVSKETRTAAP